MIVLRNHKRKHYTVFVFELSFAQIFHRDDHISIDITAGNLLRKVGDKIKKLTYEFFQTMHSLPILDIGAHSQHKVCISSKVIPTEIRNVALRCGMNMLKCIPIHLIPI